MNSLNPSPAAEPDQRLLGTLIHIFPTGYGFLHVRDGQPDYFIHARDVPNKAHWRRNQEFHFTPLPPLSGKPNASPRAGDPVPYLAAEPKPARKGLPRSAPLARSKAAAH